MDDRESAIAEAFAEAQDDECGLGLPGLEARVGGTTVTVTWHEEVVAAWGEEDPEDPFDPEDVAAELLAAMQDPRSDVVEVALRVAGRELPRAQAVARRVAGDEAAVSLEDRGDLGRARHWTTDAELSQGWPELVVVVSLGDTERALPFAPEQHPHALDLVEIERAAQELTED